MREAAIGCVILAAALFAAPAAAGVCLTPETVIDRVLENRPAAATTVLLGAAADDLAAALRRDAGTDVPEPAEMFLVFADPALDGAAVVQFRRGCAVAKGVFAAGLVRAWLAEIR